MKAADGFVEIVGITAAVVLVNHWLKGNGILSGNGYATKPQPKPKPAYNPAVVNTLKQARTSIPAAPAATLQKLQRSINALEDQERGLVKAQEQMSAAIREKERLLAEQRARIAQAQSNLERKIQQENLRDIEASANRMIESEKESFERSAFKAQLDSKYREAIAAARDAYKDRFNLVINRGGRSEAAIEKVKEALFLAADEEFATSEGSVERSQ